MDTLPLTPNGPDIGRLAYGCWRFAATDVDTAHEKIVTALDAGMTLIDTADIYGADTDEGFGSAEALLGEVLEADSGLRGRMILATKGGIWLGAPYDSSRDYLTAAFDRSLERLKVDQVDLYQLHRPDLLTPMAELAETLDGFVASGKTRYIGVSNFRADQIRALAANMKTPIISVQNEFSVLCQDPIEDGVLSWCEENSALFMAWSPLGGGRLFSHGGTATDASVRETVGRLAKEKETDEASIALSFLSMCPGPVIPIIGTQNVDRIAALGREPLPALTRREWYDIVEAYRGGPMP